MTLHTGNYYFLGCSGKDLIDNVCGKEGWKPVKEEVDLVCKQTDNEGESLYSNKPWLGYRCNETNIRCPPDMFYQEDQHKCITIQSDLKDDLRKMKDAMDKSTTPGAPPIIPQFYH